MAYSNSPLATSSYSTKNKSIRTGKIQRITIHHMAGKMTGLACAKMHANGTRANCSANYYIGYNGDICLGVPEKYRAWTTANAANDNIAVTIEVSNNQIGGNWSISDKTFNSLIALCIDICKRNNIPKVYYDGTKTAPLNAHFMFSATACPGPYTKHLQESGIIAQMINSGITGNTADQSTNPSSSTSNSTTEKNPYTAPTKQVNYGAKGSNVGWIQWQLTKIFGYNMTIDSIFGRVTSEALMDFQERNGIQRNVNCTVATINKLKDVNSVGANGIKKINLINDACDYTNVFDAQYYANNYKDLRDVYGYDSQKLFDHFLKYGMKEMRQACMDFNVIKYASNYEDLRNAFGALSPDNSIKYYQHYCICGRKEGRIAI